MNFAQEIERLAKLYAEGALTAEEFTKAKNQLLSTPAFSKFPVKGIRHESARKFFGLPLWAIAIGGGACGYYALGGGAIGAHTISATHQDPAALDFFKQYFRGLTDRVMRTR